MSYLFYFLVYGFLATVGLGLLASWLDRKITARVQYRQGPPLFQPLIDIIKLLGKETLIPRGAAKFTFLAAPVVGLAGVILAATILWMNALNLSGTFLGDLIVVVYLLVIPSISLIMAGFASANPLASLGASREMKLILSYELPFILAILVPVIKSGFSLKLGVIISQQIVSGIFLTSWSGFLALVAALLCVQAKLALAPFDIPEAETEIMAGPLIEYSGPSLAIFKLMKNMLLFILPFFLVIMFLGGLGLGNGYGIMTGFFKILIILLLITVTRNTNPRLRIDQALKFFWGPVTIMAVVAVILAVKGF